MVSLCLCSACITQAPANPAIPQNVSPVIDVGLVPITPSSEPQFISFNEARSNLGEREIQVPDSDDNKNRIVFIRGMDLDESGNARQWFFGIRGDSINEIRVYDRSGWTIIPWNSTTASEEIDLDTVISPDRLFETNTGEILGMTPRTMPVRRDLELINGTYKLTINSDSTTRILTFNATTGAQDTTI